MYGTQVGFLSIREYCHCAFLMFSKCTVWLSFNVNLCALLFTIELKLGSFQSEYYNCAFLSFLSAQFCFVSMPNVKIACLSVHHRIIRRSLGGTVHSPPLSYKIFNPVFEPSRAEQMKVRFPRGVKVTQRASNPCPNIPP